MLPACLAGSALLGRLLWQLVSPVRSTAGLATLVLPLLPLLPALPAVVTADIESAACAAAACFHLRVRFQSIGGNSQEELLSLPGLSEVGLGVPCAHGTYSVSWLAVSETRTCTSASSACGHSGGVANAAGLRPAGAQRSQGSGPDLDAEACRPSEAGLSAMAR